MAYPPPPPPREPQQDPPPRYPVTELRCPNQRDAFFSEVVNRADSTFQKFLPIARGTPYSMMPGADSRLIAAYAANPFYFLKEVKIGGANNEYGNTSDWVIWIWANQMLAQDEYNAEVTYEEDGVSFPVYQREYYVKRQLWEATPTIATASALTSLLSVAITAGGANYTQATGTTGNAIAEAVCYNGAIIDWVVTVGGSSIVDGANLVIVGDGTGATATARIQPESAVLISQEERELDDNDPRSHDYVRIIRTYATMPGPILTDTYVSGDVRGEPILTTVQKGLIGTLPPETTGLIISSETQQISAVVEQRTTKYLANLPASQLYASWGFVPLPLLVFDIENNYFCNGSNFFSMVTNYPGLTGGSSVLRKLRITDGYLAAAPNLTPDLSTSSFSTVDLRYQGRVINFSLSNVLNDAISYDQDFQQWDSSETCFWTEAYDFPATTPSATEFAAGLWFVKDYDPRQFGVNMFHFIKVEYYSAEGNPDITI